MTALSIAAEDGIAIVTFDTPGESVNIISRSVKNEFIALFQHLESDESIKAAVLISGKPDSFIAGADTEAPAGVAVEPTPQALAEALAEVAKHPEYAANARARYEAVFAPEVVLRQLIGVYEELLSE